MSSQNEEVLKLKNEIIECQEETLQLLHEKPFWADQYNDMNTRKQKAIADLAKHSIQTSGFEKKLNSLNNSLRLYDDIESEMKESLDNLRVGQDKYKEKMGKNIIEVEGRLGTVEKEFSVTRENRLQMEKSLENLNVFCEAMYSTLKPKNSSRVSLVKEAQLDPYVHNGQKMRKRRGSKKSK